MINKYLVSVAVALSCGSAFAATDLALGKSTTASSFYDSGTEVFPSANITDGITLDSGTASNWSFWLAAQGKTAGEWVQVDLGSNFNISNVTLFDTHNRSYNDRGTNEFSISLSTDGNNFQNVASDSFSYSEWVNQTAKSVDIAPSVGRYVRFNVVSPYGGQSAGLAEMQVYGSVAAVPEPETYAMLLAGLGLMGTIARRRKAKSV
jgi:hypothetical protein